MRHVLKYSFVRYGEDPKEITETCPFDTPDFAAIAVEPQADPAYRQLRHCRVRAGEFSCIVFLRPDGRLDAEVDEEIYGHPTLADWSQYSYREYRRLADQALAAALERGLLKHEVAA